MLKDIIDEIIAEHGEDITTPSQRALHLRKINRVAQFVYNLGDIWGSLDEEVFDFNVESAQVTLPDYVGHVRGARYYDIRYKAPVDAMGNRFNTGTGNELWYLNLREKTHGPLKRNITNQSILKLSIPLAEETAIIVDIVGPTDNSAKVLDSITIPAGTIAVNGVKNFLSPLTSIRKNRKTTYDVTIKDVEDNIIAVIPNHQYSCRYTIFQVYDSPFSAPSNSTALAMEIWFKKRFMPYVDDSDVFTAGEEYEDAIYKLYAADRAKDMEVRDMLIKEAMRRVGDIHKDHDNGKIKKLTFGTNPYFHMDYNNLLPSPDSCHY